MIRNLLQSILFLCVCPIATGVEGQNLPTQLYLCSASSFTNLNEWEVPDTEETAIKNTLSRLYSPATRPKVPAFPA